MLWLVHNVFIVGSDISGVVHIHASLASSKFKNEIKLNLHEPNIYVIFICIVYYSEFTNNHLHLTLATFISLKEDAWSRFP